MNRDDYLREISDHLGRVAYQVEMRNCINLFDLNIAAEDFYKGLLNLVYSLNLVNLNRVEPNAKAIDLGDCSARKCIQVTSDNSIVKIRDTVAKFEEDGRDADYDELTVLLLKKKKKYRELPSLSKANLKVKDYLNLTKDIRENCDSIEKLGEIACYLESELVKEAQSRGEADAQILETFADNASRYIAKVAENIVSSNQNEISDLGLDSEELIEKFQKMKCSHSYKKKFDRHAAFFPAVNDIITTDAVKGGATTIRAIVGIIVSIYSEILDQSVNGDRIHNRILASLIQNGNFSAEEMIATETLIFYTINECGIFNEVK